MDIQLFNSPQFGQVRTSGTPEEPIFCAADICRALGYNNGRDAIARHCDVGDVVKRDTPTSSGIQSMTFVNESGLYALIFGSKLDSAKQFKKWVTGEVLPTIRKTGAYATAEVMEKAMSDPDFAISVFQQIKDLRQKNQMLEGKNAILEKENKELAPRAEYTDKVLQSTGNSTFTEVAKELNIRSGEALIKKLLDKKIIFKQGKRYLPFAKYSEMGYFDSRTHHFFHADGRPDTSKLTVVTEKGRMWLHEMFNVDLQPIDLTMFNL